MRRTPGWTTPAAPASSGNQAAPIGSPPASGLQESVALTLPSSSSASRPAAAPAMSAVAPARSMSRRSRPGDERRGATRTITCHHGEGELSTAACRGRRGVDSARLARGGWRSGHWTCAHWLQAMAGIDGTGDAPTARRPEFDGGTRELREVGGRGGSLMRSEIEGRVGRRQWWRRRREEGAVEVRAGQIRILGRRP